MISEARLREISGMKNVNPSTIWIGGQDAKDIARELLAAREVVRSAEVCLKFHSPSATHTKDSWGELNGTLTAYDKLTKS